MISPALITDNKRIAEERIRLARDMDGWLHVDVLDKSIYPYSSLSITEMESLDYGDLQLEFHAMTNTPLDLADSELPIDRLIMHVEIPRWEEFYADLIHRDVNVWLAIAPETDIASLDLPEDVNGILLMGVIPGLGGQSFLEVTYDRLDYLLESYPALPITIDGGVNEENIQTLLAYGVENFVAGSALFSQKDPVFTYKKLNRLADPLSGNNE
jgi:ribulose-phosphate 3-epimerase